MVVCEDPRQLYRVAILNTGLHVSDEVDARTCDGTGGSRKALSTAAARILLLFGMSSAESTATRPAEPLPAQHADMGSAWRLGQRSPKAPSKAHCLHIPDL